MSKKDERKAEWKRGAQDALQASQLLRARWPKAFPANAQEIRPLVSVAAELQEAFGWSYAYARAVLRAWKMREAYCRAVLLYPQRINLDGSVSDETVDDRSRALAKERLEQLAARKTKAKAAERAREAERAAAEASAQPEPAPEPVPTPATPEAERPRARKLLTAGSAAKEALLKRGLGTTEVVATIQRPTR